VNEQEKPALGEFDKKEKTPPRAFLEAVIWTIIFIPFGIYYGISYFLKKDYSRGGVIFLIVFAEVAIIMSRTG
jgi:cytochrome c oxidase subunit IV